MTWYSKLLAAILFIIIAPALTSYIGRQYEATLPTNASINSVVTYKWPTVSWTKYTSQASKLSFEYPSDWTVKDDKSYSNKMISQYEYPHILVCPPDYEQSLVPKDESPNNCIDFKGENTLIHPLPDEDLINFDYFKPFMSTIEYPGHPNYYDTNIMIDRSNYFIGFKRKGDRFIGIQQTTCLQGQDTQCIIVFRHVLDSIAFGK